MNAIFKSPLYLLILGFGMFFSSLHGQDEEKKALTIDDVLAMKQIKESAISPDGQWVAFVVEQMDFEKNKIQSNVWIVNPFGPTTTQLTFPEEGRHYNIQWHPKGDYIAFIGEKTKDEADEEDGEAEDAAEDDEEIIPQVFGVSPEGGGAFQITDFERPISKFRISPNGKKIAFIAKPEKTEEQEAKEKERGRPIIWGQAYDDQWDRLWVASLNEQSASGYEIYSEEKQQVRDLYWSPDSKQIAFCVSPSPILRAFYDTDIYLVEEAGVTQQLTQMPGYERPVSWTETHGLIVEGKNQRLGTGNVMLWSVDLSNGVPAPITIGLDEHARFVAITDELLYVEVPYKTKTRLYKIPMSNGIAKGAPKIISDDKMYYSQFSITEDGSKVAFLGEGPNVAPDIYHTLTEDFKPQIATELQPEMANFKLGKQRVVQWRSDADSEVIEGILTLPADYEQGDRVPLLLVVHGGPAGVSTNRFWARRGAYPIQVFANKGYAVLQPNYRGSTGYGARFRGLNRGDISGNDWLDVNSGVDAMVKEGIADPKRVGIMGWSFGGHHTFWGITQTNRFRAASAGAGATDLISMYSQTDLPEFYHVYLGPKPWEDFELYEQKSAYRYVNQVQTPLLIQVGENDERVPAEQSIQFYEALKSIGNVDTELIIYPGQGHGIRAPRLIKDLVIRNVEWFEKYIPTK